MNTKTEGTIAIIAALFVLFSAMWDPRFARRGNRFPMWNSK